MREALQSAWNAAARLWSPELPPEKLEAAFAEMKARQPVPTFWLLGKTQSGKTSIVKYLTGADDAAIGSGFRPCTRTSREFPFPDADAPILNFLDTRGFDEPGYDPAADIAAFEPQTHLVIVTAKIGDFAQHSIREALSGIRALHRRPAILVLTCLHEAVAGRPLPPEPEIEAAEPFAKMIAEHLNYFESLVDAVVLVDLTRPEDGFANPHYNGERLRSVLLDHLPAAYRQSLLRVADAMSTLKDLHDQKAVPVIIAYASMAAAAAATPVPFVDLVALPAIQARMAFHLARQYGQEMTATRLVEIGGSLGLGLLARQAIREVAKLVPVVGSAASASLAWASTYALGRALCEYYESVHDGHLPPPERLTQLYSEQFSRAKARWADRA